MSFPPLEIADIPKTQAGNGASIDSQSVATTEMGGEKEFNP